MAIRTLFPRPASRALGPLGRRTVATRSGAAVHNDHSERDARVVAMDPVFGARVNIKRIRSASSTYPPQNPAKRELKQWRTFFETDDKPPGVGDQVRQEFMGLDTVRLCRNDGRVLRQFDFSICSGGPHELIGVKRARLQQILFEQLPPGQVVLNAPVESVSTADGSPCVRLQSGKTLAARLVIGADGVRSVVARSLGVPPANYTGQAAYRGVATFDGPTPVLPRTVCQADLPSRCVQIWGEGNRAGVYPMSANEVYWFVTFDAAEALPQRTQAEMRADALRIVDGWQHSIADCVLNTPDGSISCNRFADRWPTPLTRFGAANVTLVGDAFHPVTPDLGQGGCMALEDGVVLARELRSVWGTPGAGALQPALDRYKAERVRRCLPVAVRSRGMGAVLQSPLPPVVFARDNVVKSLLDVSHFFDHTLYDCGTLS